MITYSFENYSNVTTSSMATTTTAPLAPAYIGFITIFIAVFGLGSNYLPVKKYETGDGMFFQLVFTMAIWTTGFVGNWIREFPTFYALPMLGGFFWTTGNLSIVHIINTIGIGLGSTLWNTMLLIFGWGIARIGLFGVKPEVPSNPLLNYIGVALILVSGIFYLLVKTDSKIVASSSDNEQDEENEAIINNNDDESHTANTSSYSNNYQVQAENSPIFYERLSVTKKRIIGISLSLISGILFAFTFTPALYVQDNYPNASQNALDYVLSLYTGIFCTSLVYFSIYCIYKRNRPIVYPKLFLPTIASGVVWAISNQLFFVSNNSLTQAISFPIISSGPSIIASLYGIFLFKEIRGARNLILLSIGFAITIAGSVLCGISK